MGVGVVWLVEVGLVGERSFGAEGRALAASVVKALDIIEGGCGQFMFERAPGRFQGGIVVAVARRLMAGSATVRQPVAIFSPRTSNCRPAERPDKTGPGETMVGFVVRRLRV
jgi:hypothetical protein